MQRYLVNATLEEEVNILRRKRCLYIGNSPHLWRLHSSAIESPSGATLIPYLSSRSLLGLTPASSTSQLRSEAPLTGSLIRGLIWALAMEGGVAVLGFLMWRAWRVLL